MPSPYDIAAIQIADCESCGAAKGDQCFSSSGLRRSMSCHYRRRMALQRWRQNGHLFEYKELMIRIKMGPEYGLSGC